MTTRICLDAQGLNRIGTCYRPLQENLNQCVIGLRSLSGSADPRGGFLRCLDYGTQCEDWMRRLTYRCDDEYTRTLSGPWASGFCGRTRERYVNLSGCIDRCRAIYDSWCRRPQESSWRLWEDPEWSYTCGQLEGCVRDVDWDYRDCYSKYTQVCGLSDPGYPRTYFEPARTYTCSYPAPVTTIKSTYTCAYPSWYNDPGCVRWLGGCIYNKQTSPCPQPFDFRCGYSAAGSTRWSTVNGLNPAQGGFYAL